MRDANTEATRRPFPGPARPGLLAVPAPCQGWAALPPAPRRSRRLLTRPLSFPGAVETSPEFLRYAVKRCRNSCLSGPTQGAKRSRVFI